MLPSGHSALWNIEQLSGEVESHEQAVSTNMLWVNPHCPLCCWRLVRPPVCSCILYPSASPTLPTFLHISTSSFRPSFCLVWVLACRACPAPLRSAPLPPSGSVAWLPGGGSLLTSGAAGMPDGPIHQTWGRGVGGPTVERRGGLHRGPCCWLYWDGY